MRSLRPWSPARGRQLGQNAFGHFLGIADDADGDALGEPDAVGVDVDLNDLRLLRPIVEAIAGKRREGIEPGAEAEHDIGLGDQFHRGLGAVVAQRASEQRMRAREGVVVLIADADRRIETLGQLLRGGNGATDHHAGAVEDHRELRFGQKLGCGCKCIITTGRALELDDGRQIDIDHLGEVVARHVDLGRGRETLGIHDDAVEDFGDAVGIAHLFLIADHVLEQRHLLDFLEAALADGAVGGLRRHQQQRRVVPVGGFHGGDEVGDAGTVLGDHHRHLAGGPGVAIGHHAARALVGAIEEGDAGLGEQIRDRHEGRADDAEGNLDSMHLQNLDEGLFGGHAHSVSLQEFDAVVMMPDF